jgi:hypothetical protein
MLVLKFYQEIKSKTMIVRFLLILILCVCVFNTELLSQQAVKDSKGTDFWLTFLPNYHSLNSAGLDSLYIFVSAEVPTTGTIDYTDINGNTLQHNFTITDVSNVHQFVVWHSNYELRGFNQGRNNFSQIHQLETPAPQSFHIVTDNEVTVYGLNQASNSSDAFLVLPTDALGKEYFVLSYPSDGKSTLFLLDESLSTPSEFAIVATEDNTEVEITLSTNRSYRTNGKTITTTLQQGESFLVQANITRTQRNDDLTGTQIIATKPISLIAGHQRASVPLNGSGQSRDHICEQIPPYDTWGNNAYVVPFVPGVSQSPEGRDRFVILSGTDDNVIYRNNVASFTLNKGEKREFDLLNAESIRGTFPILVATYKKQSGSGVSDPLMMIIPPAEQFLKSYKWINAQVEDIFEEQFTTIVAPNATIPSIRVDNQAIVGNFLPIPTTNYSYITVKLTDGVHTVTADRKIGIYVYGYGRTDSYGYTGGMQLLNQFKPVISVFPERIEAKSGDTTSLGLFLDSIGINSPTISQADVAKARIIASVNATVATPMSKLDRGEIKFGRQYIDIEIPLQRNVEINSLLKSIPIVLGIGDAEKSEVIIESVTWLTQDNDTIWSETTTKNGEIVVTDVWKDDFGVRLINPQEIRIGLTLNSNIADVELNFSYKNITVNLPISLEIVNVNGSTIQRNNELITATDGVNSIDVSGLPNGKYFLKLSNGTNIVVREFTILR